MGKEIRIKCRKIYGGKATGEALVTREAVSGWGGTDPLAGKIIERTHEISGGFQRENFHYPGRQRFFGLDQRFSYQPDGRYAAQGHYLSGDEL